MQPIQPPELKLRKKRTFGEVISDTFLFIKLNFKPLFKTVLFIAGPFMLLTAIYFSVTNVKAFDFYSWRFNTTRYFESVMLAMLFLILSFNLQYTLINSYIKLYARDGMPPSMSEVWQSVKRLFLKVLGITIILAIIFIGVMAVSALLFAALPGFFKFFVILGLFILMPFLFVKLSLAYAAGVLDDYGVGDSIARSWDFTNFNFWMTLGLIIVFSMITGLAAIAVGLPAGIIQLVAVSHGLQGAGLEGTTKMVFVVFQVIASIAQQLAYLILCAGLCIHYLSIQEKREGRGLIDRINQLDTKE